MLVYQRVVVMLWWLYGAPFFDSDGDFLRNHPTFDHFLSHEYPMNIRSQSVDSPIIPWYWLVCQPENHHKQPPWLKKVAGRLTDYWRDLVIWSGFHMEIRIRRWSLSHYPLVNWHYLDPENATHFECFNSSSLIFQAWFFCFFEWQGLCWFTGTDRVWTILLGWTTNARIRDR